MNRRQRMALKLQRLADKLEQSNSKVELRTACYLYDLSVLILNDREKDFYPKLHEFVEKISEENDVTYKLN